MTQHDVFNNSTPVRDRSLWDFHEDVSEFEFRNPPRARAMLAEFLEEVDRYYGPPDIWHNAAMVAGRVRLRDAQIKIVRAGQRQWPNDVDLLCDELQYSYASSYDPARAREIWATLSNDEVIPPQEKGPYWRYWCYGAIYHARMLNDVEAAVALLDRGLNYVKRDGLQDIIRTYRNVLMDHVPARELDGLEAVTAYQDYVFETLTERYKLGLKMGVENGYVLATLLARLYQERAGRDVEDSDSPQEMRQKTDESLRKALRYLELAESLFTANPNHPIYEIYEQRVRVLMALREYDEAGQYLGSLPSIERRRDLSLPTMMKLAEAKTGTRFGNNEVDSQAETSSMDEEQLRRQVFPRVVDAIFAEDGEQLMRLIDDDPRRLRVMLKVISEIQERMRE